MTGLMHKLAVRRASGRAFTALIISIVALASYAVQPADGYFTGVDLQPVGDAAISTVETEPAVALVFAVDQKTADVTREFDAWFKRTDRPDINVFAIGVDPADLSDDIVLEAINQRNLSMPVFLASADMLLGDDFRLVLLDGDSVVERLSSIDVGVLNAAISRLGIEVPPAAPATTPAVAVPEPTPSVSITEVPEVGAPLDDTPVAEPPVATAQTPASTEAERTSRIAGGDRDNLYSNSNYGFSVRFPPNWKYQIAAREDGAVAIEPSGSQMDMRVWAEPFDMSDPQAYIDQRLEALAKRHSTRVNIERRFMVREDGLEAVDVTYNFARPMDASVPARGFLRYRGRLQVFVDDGYVKAASVEAPGGEFSATFPMIESFFRSFEVQQAGYNSPVL